MVINQQLWCCCYDAGIIVFDGELQRQRLVPAGDMGNVFEAAALSTGDVVLATARGLYHADVTGKLVEIAT